MTLFPNLPGHVAALAPDPARQKLPPLLVPGERVEQAGKLFRDLRRLTGRRGLTLDQPGVTGRTQSVTSIPCHSIKKFARESAGRCDLDAALHRWITGEDEPLQWPFSRSVDSNATDALRRRHILDAR